MEKQQQQRQQQQQTNKQTTNNKQQTNQPTNQPTKQTNNTFLTLISLFHGISSQKPRWFSRLPSLLRSNHLPLHRVATSVPTLTDGKFHPWPNPCLMMARLIMDW
jgi:hypothetical protein